MTILQVTHNGCALDFSVLTMEEYNEFASIWNGEKPRPIDDKQPPIPYNLDSSFVRTQSRPVYWVHYYTPIINGDIVGLLESLKPHSFAIFSFNRSRETQSITALKQLLEDIGFTGLEDRLFQRN